MAGRCLGRYASRAGPVARSLAHKAVARVQHTAPKVARTALRHPHLGNQRGAIRVRYTADQQALIQLARHARRKGVTLREAVTLRAWAREVGLKSRGPEAHPGRRHGRYPHIHIGPINHIFIRRA